MIRVSAVSLVLAFAGFQKFIERYISVMISYACEGIRRIWVWFEIFQYSFNVSSLAVPYSLRAHIVNASPSSQSNIRHKLSGTIATRFYTNSHHTLLPCSMLPSISVFAGVTQPMSRLSESPHNISSARTPSSLPPFSKLDLPNSACTVLYHDQCSSLTQPFLPSYSLILRNPLYPSPCRFHLLRRLYIIVVEPLDPLFSFFYSLWNRSQDSGKG